MAIIFFVIGYVVPRTPGIDSILIPGIEGGASYLIGAITLGITVIFLIRALYDALVLGDIVTDIIVRRLGIKGERSPRRAARDFIYIIVIILVITAIFPVVVMVKWPGESSWLAAATIYIALGLIIVLIYDIGRVIYRVIEQKAELLADSLSKIAETDESG
jgi:hypothetical protein